MVRPLADFDLRQGHGNRECRYEPSPTDLEHYRANPEDVAIVVPHDRLDVLPEDPRELSGHVQLSAYNWRAYARFHGYAFYMGVPPGSREACPGLGARAPQWLKPCAALRLLPRHRFLVVVDADTLALRPRLRLEPLLAGAGLLAGRAAAVAEEWGSCGEGRRHPPDGGSNTGVLLLRRSAEAQALLEAWFSRPAECEAQLARRGLSREAAQELLARGEAEPDDCMVLVHSLDRWAFDQLAFGVVSRAFRGSLATLRAGCPVNSPWADFIAHFVAGTPSELYYSPGDRELILRRATRCVAEALSPDSRHDDYVRCSICGLLSSERPPSADRGRSPWNISCPAA